MNANQEKGGGLQYAIEVHAIGYEDTTLVLNVKHHRDCFQTNNRLLAIQKWLEHNDLDADSTELPFIRVRKV